MVRACNMNGEMRNAHELFPENLKGKDHFGDVNERITSIPNRTISEYHLVNTVISYMFWPFFWPSSDMLR